MFMWFCNQVITKKTWSGGDKSEGQRGLFTFPFLPDMVDVHALALGEGSELAFL